MSKEASEISLGLTQSNRIFMTLKTNIKENTKFEWSVECLLLTDYYPITQVLINKLLSWYGVAL